MGRLMVLFLALLFPGIVISQAVTRVEPPNWWVGMKNSVLQIMLYGKDLQHTKAEVESEDARLISTILTENPNYLFLNLEIDSNAKAGFIPISLHSNGQEVWKTNYPIWDREENAGVRQGYSAQDVIYLITPDRFANGDPSNDHVEGMFENTDRTDKNKRHGGDIEGIRRQLPYIKDMGFTAIWPNPVLENNMPRTSYHGYAVTDFYRVDPRMGSNESYREMCKQANATGIKVIMDMVHNHCGSEHWWMHDPPMKDWINFYDQTYTQTNHRKTIQADLYSAVEDQALLEDGWFVPSMPDLNVRQPVLAKYLIQNSIWWIEYADLSGIRMDTYLYPDDEYMAQWTQAVMTEYPYFNITGEVWYIEPAIISYWQRGHVNKNGYVSYLPSLFDFPLQTALSIALNQPESWGEGWVTLYETLAQDFLYTDPFQLVVFPDNHDMSRIFTQLNEDISKTKMALAFLLTCRGIPQIFYGTEILMGNPGTDDHTIIRSDFPGGWPGDEINGFTGEGLSPEQEEMQRYVRQLLQWRKKATVIHHGKTTHYTPREGVYVLFRYDDHHKVMIILNKNIEPYTLELNRFGSMLNGYMYAVDVLGRQEWRLDSEIRLESPGPLILELRR